MRKGKRKDGQYTVRVSIEVLGPDGKLAYQERETGHCEWPKLATLALILLSKGLVGINHRWKVGKSLAEFAAAVKEPTRLGAMLNGKGMVLHPSAGMLMARAPVRPPGLPSSIAKRLGLPEPDAQRQLEDRGELHVEQIDQILEEANRKA